MRLLRIYHGGRDPIHRARDRALGTECVDVQLAVPSTWPGGQAVSSEPFAVLELEVGRPGDVNRHAYVPSDIARTLAEAKPDILDIHEEPFSVAARQWLAAAPPDLPVVMYTAQNVDKRLPPPFDRYERAAYRRVAALYPCSRQAASVARGKGFDGPIEVLPLGYDDTAFHAGTQSADDAEIVLGLFGRLVPEKGVRDAVRILAQLTRSRPARLLLVGTGPEAGAAAELARSLAVIDRVELIPWLEAEELTATYRSAHVVLVPSTTTRTWVEQFGRVIVEGQASGAVVAAYSSGAIPEVAGEAALLAPEGRWEELARRIETLLGDPDEFERRRQAGLAQCVDRTWTRVAEWQAALYRRVLEGGTPRRALPRSPAQRRQQARSEFGPTAPTTAGERPFALPVLREGGQLAGAIGAVIDLGAEALARHPLHR